jgi:hypothetical protein
MLVNLAKLEVKWYNLIILKYFQSYWEYDVTSCLRFTL